jgi:hypothetical protein
MQLLFQGFWELPLSAKRQHLAYTSRQDTCSAWAVCFFRLVMSWEVNPCFCVFPLCNSAYCQYGPTSEKWMFEQGRLVQIIFVANVIVNILHFFYRDRRTDWKKVSRNRAQYLISLLENFLNHWEVGIKYSDIVWILSG